MLWNAFKTCLNKKKERKKQNPIFYISYIADSFYSFAKCQEPKQKAVYKQNYQAKNGPPELLFTCSVFL